MKLELTVDELAPGCKVIRASGEIDMHTVQSLDDTVLDLLDEEPQAIVLNLAKLNYISSSGIGVIMNCHAEMVGRGGVLVLTGVHGNVEQSLQLTGILDMTPHAKTEEEAIKMVGELK